MFTARRTAELIKYAANAFLATKITFINEIADLSEKVGADIQEVARGIGLDNRIGPKFLHAGPGFGGSCFPKDTRALIKIALDHDVPLRIVEAVLAVNDNRKRAMARKVSNAAGGSLRGKTVAVLGVTEWVQYRTLDLPRLKRELAQPVVVDLRNIYRPEEMAALGFTYESVGRPAERRD